MKITRALILGVSACIAGGTILFCSWGCGSEPRSAAEGDKQAQAPQAPAQAVGNTERDQVRALIARTTPPPPASAQPKDVAKTAAVPAAAAAPATVTHVVGRSETLASISQKYYGNRANWKLIMDANSTVLKTPKDLRPGMTLVIPVTKAMKLKTAASQPAKPGVVPSAKTRIASRTTPA